MGSPDAVNNICVDGGGSGFSLFLETGNAGTAFVLTVEVVEEDDTVLE